MKRSVLCLILLLCVGILNAQMVTGVWRGTITKGSGLFAKTMKLEVKLIKKGDSLLGTSYYYINSKIYMRYSVRGYFDAASNSVHWQDHAYLLSMPPKTAQSPDVRPDPMKSVADFNCPNPSAVMKLDGISTLGEDQMFDTHLTKVPKSFFPDEWDKIIEGYTAGMADPDIIDSVWAMASVPENPLLAKGREEERAKQEEIAKAKVKAEAEEKAKQEEVAKAKVKAEAEEKAKQEEVAKAEAKAEAEEKARLEEVAKAKAVAEEKARQEEIAKAEARVKAEAEEKAKQEEIAKAKVKAEAEEKARLEEVARTKAAEEEKAKQEEIAKAKVKAEAEEKAKKEEIAKAEAEAKVRAEAEEKAKQAEVARKAADEKARQDAILKAKAIQEKALEEARAQAKAAQEERARQSVAAREKAEAAEKAQQSASPGETAIAPGSGVVSGQKPPDHSVNPLPAIQDPEALKKFTARRKIQQGEVPMVGDSIELHFYDNAEVDGDSISLFINGKLMFNHVKLTSQPYIFKLAVKDLPDNSEMAMLAENLGAIPPNTALMLAFVNGERYAIRLESTESSTGMVKLVRRE